jgi:hypothetical protein
LNRHFSERINEKILSIISQNHSNRFGVIAQWHLANVQCGMG